MRALVLVAALFQLVPCAFTQGTLEDYQRAQRFLPGNLRHSIYVADVSAHWIDKTNRFWYHKVSQKGSEFIAVDAEHDTMGPAFDHEKLAGALAIASKRQVSTSDLPFDTIEFAEDGKTVRFEVDDSHWACTLADYKCEKQRDEKSDEALSPD